MCEAAVVLEAAAGPTRPHCCRSQCANLDSQSALAKRQGRSPSRTPPRLRVDWCCMSSWYDAWADRYEEEGSARAADVPFYVGLAGNADGPLVELGFGTGRVAIPVAQATGRRVIAIDS